MQYAPLSAIVPCFGRCYQTLALLRFETVVIALQLNSSTYCVNESKQTPY